MRDEFEGFFDSYLYDIVNTQAITRDEYIDGERERERA